MTPHDTLSLESTIKTVQVATAAISLQLHRNCTPITAISPPQSRARSRPYRWPPPQFRRRNFAAIAPQSHRNRRNRRRNREHDQDRPGGRRRNCTAIAPQLPQFRCKCTAITAISPPQSRARSRPSRRLQFRRRNFAAAISLQLHRNRRRNIAAVAAAISPQSPPRFRRNCTATTAIAVAISPQSPPRFRCNCTAITAMAAIAPQSPQWLPPAANR